ncbi:MAG: hypothetical protein ACLQUY_25750 [Ktedonobacterales bacterium]
MAAVTTERLMEIALEMASYINVPPDSSIYYAGTHISHILLGIDVGSAELFMARQLGYHAVIAHRPPGHPGPVWEVYRDHVAQMEESGVPHAIAQAAVARRIEMLEAEALLENYDRTPSVARLLEMPLLNILSPLESIGRRRLRKSVDEACSAKPDITVGELRDVFLGLPELAAAHTAPRLALGDWSRPAGTVAISYGAYLPPDASIARAYLEHTVDTLICAGFAGCDAQQLAGNSDLTGTILTLGSLPTASLGLNPYISRLRAEGLEVAPFSGIIGLSK